MPNSRNSSAGQPVQSSANRTVGRRQPTVAAVPTPEDDRRSTARRQPSAVRSSLESMIGAEAILLDFTRTLFEERTKEALQSLVGLAPELAASSERFVFNKPCSGERKFCWTEFPVAGVQAIRDVAGGTANDVILTVVTRAVSRYLRAHGEDIVEP